MGEFKERLAARDRDIRSESYPELVQKSENPVLWEVIFTRLQGVVQNAKEVAKHISSSPVVREMGECVFALYTPEGESVCFSTGIVLHVSSMGGAIRFMLENDYEEQMGIRHGDHFFNNDPYLGGAHSPDQSIMTPIIYEGKLVGWAGGLTHVPETGAREPGGVPATACSRYEEGIYWPCVKIAENDTPRRDLEIVIERGTRTPIWWEMDTRAKMAGIRLIRESILSLVREIGVEAYEKLIYEYIEDTRRACVAKIRNVFNPGTYHSTVFFDVANRLRPVMHQEDYEGRVSLTMTVARDGQVSLDFEGTSPAGLHSFNASPPATIGNLHLVFVQTVFYDVKYNQGLYQAVLHPNRLHLPPSTVNPPDISFACANWGPGAGSAAWTAAVECISRAYYSSGFREEVTGHRNTGAGGLRWSGRDQYGRPTAGHNFEMGCGGMPAGAIIDGLDTCYATFNPEGDMSDAEVWERVFPFVWLGRSIQRDGGGFGRYRGGSSIKSVYLVKHVDAIQISSSAPKHHVFDSPGLMGAYPTPCARRYSVHVTNLDEALAQEAPLPHYGIAPDFGGGLRFEPGPDPNITPTHLVYHNDIVVLEQGGAGAVGDPLERTPASVELDVRNGICSMATAQGVYGCVFGQDGHVLSDETEARRKEMRKARAGRAMPVGRYREQQKERVLRGDITEPAKTCLNRCLASSETFQREFVACWDLSDTFASIP